MTPSKMFPPGLTHTHTHKFVIVMLLFLRCVTAQAQAGDFQIPSNPLYDPNTTVTRCTINWINLQYATVKGINITISVSAFNTCVNNAAAAAPTVIHAGFTPSPDPNTGYAITYNNTSVNISRYLAGGFTVPAAPPYQPFVIIAFRAQPGAAATISASGTVIPMSGGALPITTASRNWTMNPGVRIGGDLTKPDGLECEDGTPNNYGFLIPGVTVTKQANTGGTCFPGASFESALFPFGTYEFLNTPYYFPYTITPTKVSTDVCCGVTSEDVDWVRDFAIGLEGNPPLWKVMAGDFNANGSTSTYDAYLMNLCVLEQSPAPYFSPGWTPWRFTPWPTSGLYSWPGAEPHDPVPAGGFASIPTSITLTPLPISSSIPAPFWGVKRGDVDGDCQDCGTNLSPDKGNERTVFDTKKLFLPDVRLEAGQETEVAIRAGELTGLEYFGVEIFFDSRKVEVLSAEHAQFTDEMAINSIRPGDNGTAVRFSWLNFEPKGIDLPENIDLFYVKLRAKQDVSSLSDALWQKMETGKNWLYIYGKDEISAFKIEVETDKSQHFFTRLIGANPVATEARVEINVPAECTAVLSVWDNQGQALYRFTRDLTAGQNNLTLPGLPSSPGMYSLQVQTAFGSQALRLVKR